MRKALFIVVGCFLVFMIGIGVGRYTKGDVVVTTPADTIFSETPVYVPEPYTLYIYDTIIQTLPEYIYDTILLTRYDTIEIVEAYLGKVYYEDSIRFDDLEAVIKDTISQNRIISRQFQYKNLRECVDRPGIILMGIEPYFGRNSGIFLSGIYQTSTWGGGIGFDPTSKSVKIGVYYKF